MKKTISTGTEAAFADAGESIRTWRKIYRLKAAQVADRAGVSLGTLRKIENGDPGVGMGAFLEVLRSLGLLDAFTESLDPLNSDLGRARLEKALPERIR
jgi:transcriptional regulator with XRE-family HTH domain